MPVWIAAAALFGAIVATPFHAAQAPPRERPPAQTQNANDELIKLAIAGMSEDILLGVVAKTDKTKYDTSADALLKLKAAGASQRVLSAILGVAPTTAPAVAPATPPVQMLATPPAPR